MWRAAVSVLTTPPATPVQARRRERPYLAALYKLTKVLKTPPVRAATNRCLKAVIKHGVLCGRTRSSKRELLPMLAALLFYDVGLEPFTPTKHEAELKNLIFLKQREAGAYTIESLSEVQATVDHFLRLAKVKSTRRLGSVNWSFLREVMPSRLLGADLTAQLNVNPRAHLFQDGILLLAKDTSSFEFYPNGRRLPADVYILVKGGSSLKHLLRFKDICKGVYTKASKESCYRFTPGGRTGTVVGDRVVLSKPAEKWTVNTVPLDAPPAAHTEHDLLYRLLVSVYGAKVAAAILDTAAVCACLPVSLTGFYSEIHCVDSTMPVVWRLTRSTSLLDAA